MTRKFMTMLTGAAAVFVASSALAGTLLPNPPFTDGGFVPPNKDDAKAEKAVAGNLNKYGGATAKCDQKLVSASTKAAGDAGKLADAATKYTDCTTKASTKFSDTAAKIDLKPHNACSNAAAQAVLKTSLDLQIDLTAGVLYCDNSGGVNGGLNYPSSLDQAKAEVAVAGIAVKAGQAVGKCFTNTTDKVFKAAGDAGKIADAVAKHNDCVAKATAKAEGSVDKLVAKATLPAGCVSEAIADAVVATALGIGGGFADEVACASPSGAFVDGTAGF